MKKLAVLGFLALVASLLMSFQNCGQEMIQGMSQFGAVQERVSPEGQKVKKLSDLTSIDAFYLLNSQLNSQFAPEEHFVSALEVDLASGRMVEVESESLEPAGLNSGKFQLSEADLSTLQDLVQDASLCRIQRSLPPDMVCAQVIIPGYAAIVTADQRFDLGLYSDACKTATVQLCNETTTEQLRRFSEMIFENLGSN